MSSLIFFSDQDQVLASTDTLATSPDGRPAFFTTKAFVLPHLRMIMCCTGVSGFLGRWFTEVNDRMVVHGIENLDYHTPIVLASLWNKLQQDETFPKNQTSTIYHMGFSEETDVIHNYVYRSVRNFESERLPYGTVIKPECHPPENLVFPICIKEMMKEQRSIQESLPADRRVYIGGKIQVYHLTKTEITIYTLDKFNDFEAMEQQIFDNYETGKKGV